MKYLIFLLCTVLSVSVFASPQLDEQIAELEREKNIIRNQLVDRRAKEIKLDRRLEKMAREIVKLNQELSEYLDTKPEIKKLNRKLQDVNDRLKELGAMKTQIKNENAGGK